MTTSPIPRFCNRTAHQCETCKVAYATSFSSFVIPPRFVQDQGRSHSATRMSILFFLPAATRHNLPSIRSSIPSIKFWSCTFLLFR